MALGRIPKKGEPYLRWLLVLGATAVVRYVRIVALVDRIEQLMPPGRNISTLMK